MKDDVTKFSWTEIFNNQDGKGSMTGVSGFIVTAIGCICFVTGVIYFILTKQPQIMMYSSGVISMGLGTLGYRKWCTPKTPVYTAPPGS